MKKKIKINWKYFILIILIFFFVLFIIFKKYGTLTYESTPLLNSEEVRNKLELSEPIARTMQEVGITRTNMEFQEIYLDQSNLDNGKLYFYTTKSNVRLIAVTPEIIECLNPVKNRSYFLGFTTFNNNRFDAIVDRLTGQTLIYQFNSSSTPQIDFLNDTYCINLRS